VRLCWLCLAACGRIGFSESTGTGDAIQLGDGSRPDIIFTSNVVFVTTQTVVPGELGGLAAADAICQTSADQSQLPGTYIAWLSTSTTNAIDRLASSRGWVRTDGIPFADQPSDIVAGTIWSPISLLADGTEQAFADPIVITGTTETGVLDATTCGDWTSTSGTFSGGFLTATSAGWSSANLPLDSDLCTVSARLYCFGIGNQMMVTTPSPTGRRAFLSTNIGPIAGGVAAMDDRCRQDAAAAQLSGSYRALIATSTMTALSRFNTTGPRWVRRDGIPLAPSAADLVTGFRIPLTLRADGSLGTNVNGWVWTGAEPNMLSEMNRSCVEWTSASAGRGGQIGYSYHNGPKAFLYLMNRRCDDYNEAIYCFEE